MAGLTDRLYGTRMHTPGALYSLPRKIPLRIEPKTFFALERTYLAWIHMAVTIGFLSTALAGFAQRPTDHSPQELGPISRRTTDVITVLLLPISLGMVAYAAWVYYWRVRNLERKEMGFYNDWLGPLTLGAVTMLALLVIFVMCAVELAVR